MARSGSDFVKGGNVPLYATCAIIVMVVSAVVLVLFANPAAAPSLAIVLGLFVSTIPALVSAVFAERVSRDVRNGVLIDKVKEGTRSALAEIHAHDGLPIHSHFEIDGVSDPVLRDNPHTHDRDGRMVSDG